MPEISQLNTSLERKLSLPQREAQAAIRQNRELGIQSGFIDMATGTGKTLPVIRDIKEELEANPSLRVLWLCHRANILEQTREECERELPADISHGNMFAGESNDQAQIVYATFQTLSKDNLYQALDPEEFNYIAIDEGHHGPAPTYQPIVDYFQPDIQKIALTATSERMDGKSMEELFGPCLYKFDLAKAIANGYLVKPDYRLYTEHEKGIQKLTQRLGTVSLTELNRQIEAVKRDEITIAGIIDEIIATQQEVDSPRTIIYCPSIEVTEEYAKSLPNTLPLHHRLKPKEQIRRFNDFKSGKIPSLTVINKISEGIHIPEVNIIVYLRSTESKAVFLQEFGRGLSIDRNNPGKEKVIFLDYAINWERIRIINELRRDIEAHYENSADNSSTATPTNSRHHRKQTNGPKPTDTPFSFAFSEEVLDAIDIIKRVNGGEKPQTMHRPRLEKRQKDLDGVCEMLNIKPESLPNQTITHKEWDQYSRRINAGDLEVVNEILMRRLRVLYAAAEKAHIDQPPNSSLSLEDCFQFIVEDFRKTAFRPRDGHHLTQQVGFAIFAAQKIVRDNNHTVDQINRYTTLKKTREKLMKSKSGFVTVADIAELTGLFEEDIELLLQQLELPPDQPTAHLEIEDDKKENNPHEASSEAIDKENLSGAMQENLSDRERNILEMRYGIGGEGPYVLDTVARKFNVTISRVRQIENHALKKLQESSIARGTLGRESFNEKHYTQEQIKIMQGRLARYTIEAEILERTIQKLEQKYKISRNNQPNLVHPSKKPYVTEIQFQNWELLDINRKITILQSALRRHRARTIKYRSFKQISHIQDQERQEKVIHDRKKYYQYRGWEVEAED